MQQLATMVAPQTIEHIEACFLYQIRYWIYVFASIELVNKTRLSLLLMPPFLYDSWSKQPLMAWQHHRGKCPWPGRKQIYTVYYLDYPLPHGLRWRGWGVRVALIHPEYNVNKKISCGSRVCHDTANSRCNSAHKPGHIDPHRLPPTFAI
jgi:hypothetical protein